MSITKKWFVLLLGLTLVMGCYTSSNDSKPKAQNEETATENAPTGADQEEWDTIHWHTASGPSGHGARQVMTLTASITSDGRFVNFGWDQYPWSSKCLAHFFVWDGQRWSGGKFEWVHHGGQSVKLLDNIRGGYNQLRAPAAGTRVAFAWTSADGRERSNLVKTTWK